MKDSDERQGLAVGTLVSPIEGLKQEDTRYRDGRTYVGTLVSPIEGLKLNSGRLGRPSRPGRNACKPD